MSLQDQNQMLYILHRNEVSRKGILFIMDDLVKNSDVFKNHGAEEDDCDDWDLLDEQAYWLFDSDASNSKKLKALKYLKLKQEEYDQQTKKSQYIIGQQKRIQTKREELIAKGVVEPDQPSPQTSLKTTTRYGRSRLHEAVAMRDICMVEKYLKRGKYLDKLDNNGHTAMEMAYYEGCQEALILFEKYEKRRKKD